MEYRLPSEVDTRVRKNLERIVLKQKMNLRVERLIFSKESTIGQLFIDDEFECFTLEDVVRAPGIKIPGQTAIPTGTYEVTIDHSARFGCDMPHILNVPMFNGIRIHSGNNAADTEGCILLGQKETMDEVELSRDAFHAFFPKLEAGLKAGKVFISIVNNYPENASI